NEIFQRHPTVPELVIVGVGAASWNQPGSGGCLRIRMRSNRTHPSARQRAKSNLPRKLPPTYQSDSSPRPCSIFLSWILFALQRWRPAVLVLARPVRHGLWVILDLAVIHIEPQLPVQLPRNI